MAPPQPLGVTHQQLLESICAAERPTADHAPLLATINRELAPLLFHHVLERDGWFRVGGVVDSSGRRISDNLREWVEEHDDDEPMALVERYIDSGYRVTRLLGTTLYFSAVDTGSSAGFVQLEIEVLHEVVDRPLVIDDWYPEDLEEFIDPSGFPRVAVAAVAEPRYRFRRVTPIEACLERDDGERRRPSALQRMLDEWATSSAGNQLPFCEAWVVTTAPFLDRDGEARYSVKLLPSRESGAALDDTVIEPGAALANLIHDFDRKSGYPMAWYFHMLARKKVSPRIAEAIHNDLMGAYDYLPPSDLKLLRGWNEKPYSV